MKRAAPHLREVWRVKGFSLLELMVSIGVLTILAVLVAHVSGAVQATSGFSNRMVDAAAQARLVFDRLAQDLGEVLNRPDADFTIRNPTQPPNPAELGNQDILRMLSAVQSANTGTGGNRGISVIGYAVNRHEASGNRPCLLRAARALHWTQTGFMGLDLNGLPPKLLRFSGEPPVPELDANLVPAAADYDVLAPGVIRLIAGCQLRPGFAVTTNLVGGNTKVDADGSIHYAPPARGETNPELAYADLSKVSALVIGLVVMDSNSASLLSPEETDTLAAAFALPASGPPLTAWSADTANLSNLPAAIPSRIRQAVRIYQRAFPISPNMPDSE